jgi:PAS domain S-box-containing protein
VLSLTGHLSTVLVAEFGQEASVEDALGRGVDDFFLLAPGQPLLDAVFLFLKHQADRYRREYHDETAQLRRLKDVLRALPDIVYEISPAGYFTFVSDSVRSLGYNPEQLVGQHFSKLLGEDQLPLVSRQEVLSRDEAREGHAGTSPKLFDERRRGKRRTEGLQIALRPNSSVGDQPVAAQSYIAPAVFGEVSAAGRYRQRQDRREFAGTVGIIRDITERRHLELERERNWAELKRIIDSVPAMIYYRDLNGRYAQVNEAFARFMGLPSHEIVGRSFEDVGSDLTPAELERQLREDRQVVETGEPVRGAQVQTGEPPNVRWLSYDKVPYWSSDGAIVGVIGVVQDVTELKQSQIAMEHSLRDKETLLKEIHHRVKNNLQIISSMLRLQGSRISDPHLEELFRASQTRIVAMAIVHEQLYQADDIGTVPALRYVRSLASYLLQLYLPDPEQIQLHLDFDDVDLDIEPAIYLGLIYNELISNALKHAFPDGRKGEVYVSLTRLTDRDYELTVRDNGVGIPEEAHANESFGMTLVETLVRQLSGTLECRTDGTGTRYRMSFPAP